MNKLIKDKINELRKSEFYYDDPDYAEGYETGFNSALDDIDDFIQEQADKQKLTGDKS